MSPTDPEAYAWPDYTDLVGRIRELEATLSRIAALHHPITDGPNEGFCDGCEFSWPCPTRQLSHPTPGVVR